MKYLKSYFHTECMYSSDACVVLTKMRIKMHKLLKFWFIHCTQLQLATKMFLLLKNICWPTGKSHGMATFQRFNSFSRSIRRSAPSLKLN